MENMDWILECESCGGLRTLSLSPDTQIKNLFAVCPACKVLATVPIV